MLTSPYDEEESAVSPSSPPSVLPPSSPQQTQNPRQLFPTLKIKIKFAGDLAFSNMDETSNGNEETNTSASPAQEPMRDEDWHKNEIEPADLPDEQTTTEGTKRKKTADESEGESDVPPAGEGLSEEIFEVAKVLNHTYEGKRRLFLVRWKGYGEDDDSWEPEANLAAAKKAINAYLANLGSASKNKKKDRTSTGSRTRGRPSKAASKEKEKPSSARKKRETSAPKSSAAKKTRYSLPQPEEDEEEVEEKSDKSDDDDYQEEKKISAREARGRNRGSGPIMPTPTKGQLKAFPKAESAAKRYHLQDRQKWLDSGSESESGSDDEKKKVGKSAKNEILASAIKPKKEMERRTREESVERREEAAKKEEARNKEKKDKGKNKKNDKSSPKHNGAAETPAVLGICRNKNKDVRVVIREGRNSPQTVSIKEAYDVVGFPLVQFLTDRIVFE